MWRIQIITFTESVRNVTVLLFIYIINSVVRYTDKPEYSYFSRDSKLIIGRYGFYQIIFSVFVLIERSDQCTHSIFD